MSNINEENIDHSNSTYNVGDEHITGNNLTTRISRLENKENRTSEEERTLEWLKGKNEKEIDKIDRPKRDRMNTGAEGTKKGGNNFKNEYKHSDIPEPNKPEGPADMSSSSKRSPNKVQYYESYSKEMENMKYLIEYMDNNKPKII